MDPGYLGFRLQCYRACGKGRGGSVPGTLNRLMVTSAGSSPHAAPQALPEELLDQSITRNLENQPSLQKERANIGNKDGYII